MRSECRFCRSPLEHTFCDLGMSPLSNAYRSASELDEPQTYYPLKAYVCSRCFLVQLPQFEAPETIFSDYAYYSSYSSTWVEHARGYADLMHSRLGLGPEHLVVEVASNDGYLLQFFQQLGVPALGIEPAENVARAAVEKGIRTRIEFFGKASAERMRQEGLAADLLLGNNVLAHVPDLRDFVAGLAVLLKPTGTLTMEFPHLLRLMQENQFDTIYHEHFSYFSLQTVESVFSEFGLEVFDVEELSTHGGSLRVYAGHRSENREPRPGLLAVRRKEQDARLDVLSTYFGLQERVEAVKRELLGFLLDCRGRGQRVAAYGAPAKGNTLLNYCGIRPDLLEYTVDKNPAKQGRFLPGSHIPIHAPEWLSERAPDYLLILPWNLKEEIVEENRAFGERGGRFAVPIPHLEVLQ